MGLKKINDLSLLLLHLTGWEENDRQNEGLKIERSWKGYLFECLNTLEEEKMIRQFQNTKSVIVTHEGRVKAEKLKSIVFNALEEAGL